MRISSRMMQLGAGALFVFLLGYLTAAMCFRKEVWIDYATGKLRTTCNLFPFSMSNRHRSRAFEILFSAPSVGETDWHLVESRAFVSLRNRCIITEGAMVVSDQNIFVSLFSQMELSREQRRRYGAIFLEKLRKEGTGSASDYVHRVWEERMLKLHGLPKPDED